MSERADDAHGGEPASPETSDPASDPDHAGDVTRTVGGERITAPMSEFTAREVGFGFVILSLGVAIAFVVPILATA